eukprot:4458738-Amphidinium_carterae.1
MYVKRATEANTERGNEDSSLLRTKLEYCTDSVCTAQQGTNLQENVMLRKPTGKAALWLQGLIFNASVPARMFNTGTAGNGCALITASLNQAACMVKNPILR